MTYWQSKTLAQMSDAEWEGLCDGCGKCCLHKLEDEDTGDIYYTNVACRLLELKTCRCRQYAERFQLVPDCLNLRQFDTAQFKLLPETCAYRVLAEGEALPAWHPLNSGNARSVVEAGVSVKSYAVPETQVEDLEDHVITWLR